jgi:cellulose biosynthesis protein BcsQ
MTRFDDVIEKALEELRATFEDLPETYLVRDTNGALVVILPDNVLSQEEVNTLAVRLHDELKPYSPGPRRVLLTKTDVIEPADIFESADKVPVPGVANVWLIDRLVTNQDWLRPSLFETPPLPTLVAFSVKGGVGRTTALGMLAWHLAREGRHVLVVDLDLEAPGIGSMLLADLPALGLVDWLIESANAPDSPALSDAIGYSPIADDAAGSVRVLPAYGTDTREYIAKLGRIYAPYINEAGEIVGLADRLAHLLDRIASLQDKPDVVLMDVRAGLHDIGSAAVTRLGAEALLFARNDGQNWWAYRQLFEHLSRSISVRKGMGDDHDLRWRLKMVAAQTEPREDSRRDWVNSSYQEWNTFYDDETAKEQGGFQPVVFDRDSSEAPHYPLFVNYDQGVRSLVLNDSSARPDWSFVFGIFGDFFRGAEERLQPVGGGN